MPDPDPDDHRPPAAQAPDHPDAVNLRGTNRLRATAAEPLSTITGTRLPPWPRVRARQLHARMDQRPRPTRARHDHQPRHHALLTYGGGRDDSGDLRHLGEPASTNTTVEQHALLDFDREREIPVEDCTFRMLELHELKLAQGFTPDYVLHDTKRQQVCQIANAVPSGPQRELVTRVIDSLT